MSDPAADLAEILRKLIDAIVSDSRPYFGDGRDPPLESLPADDVDQRSKILGAREHRRLLEAMDAEHLLAYADDVVKFNQVREWFATHPKEAAEYDKRQLRSQVFAEMKRGSRRDERLVARCAELRATDPHLSTKLAFQRLKNEKWELPNFEAFRKSYWRKPAKREKSS